MQYHPSCLQLKQGRTSKFFGKLQKFGVGQCMTINPTCLRPNALVVDSFSNDTCQILCGRKCQFHVTLRWYNSTSALQVQMDVEELYVLGRLVRRAQVIREEPELKQRVFQNLHLSIKTGSCNQSTNESQPSFLC